MKRLIAIFFFALPLVAQNYTSYGGKPLARPSFLSQARAGSGSGANIFHDTSLVGWWPLTAATQNLARDMSGNGNSGIWNGTKSGTNGYWSTGKTGPWSGYFNGSDNYLVSSSVMPSSVLGSNARTMTVWAKPYSYSSGTDDLVFYGTSSCSGSIFGIGISVTRTWSFVGCGSSYDVYSSTSVTAGVWSFVAASYDGSTVRIYLNGALIASAAKSLSTPSGKLYTASWFGSPNVSTGLQDIRLYNRALSQSEIQAIYKSGSFK